MKGPMARTVSVPALVGSILMSILILILTSPASVHSQVVGGTLSGMVTDSSGGAIVDATLSIKNMATGVSTDVTTNAPGIYNAPNLLPGSYEATVSAAGFETKTLSNIVLAVGAQQVLNFTMKMGSVTSTDRLGRGLGAELSVSGGRPQQNNYLLNGVSINDYSNQAPGSILGGNLGVDAVSEFNV